MRSTAAVAVIAASILFCGMQQRISPEHRKADQESPKAAQGNPNGSTQNAGKPSEITPADPANNDANREHGHDNQNIYVTTPDKSVDPVEHIISIVGVVCTIALAVVGVIGICIAIKTLKLIGHQSKIDASLSCSRRQTMESIAVIYGGLRYRTAIGKKTGESWFGYSVSIGGKNLRPLENREYNDNT